MEIEREFVYPDCIKFWVDGDLIATVNRRYVDEALQDYFTSMGDKVVPHQNNLKTPRG